MTKNNRKSIIMEYFCDFFLFFARIIVILHIGNNSYNI